VSSEHVTLTLTAAGYTDTFHGHLTASPLGEEWSRIAHAVSTPFRPQVPEAGRGWSSSRTGLPIWGTSHPGAHAPSQK
jgi:hypothetical protein